MRLPRVQFRVLTLMIAMTISAIIINWLRPITRSEAEKIAEAKFLEIPGSSRWIGRYRMHAGQGGTFVSDQPQRYADGWTVVLSDSRDDALLMQMFLTPNGKARAIDFAPGKFYEKSSAVMPVK